MEREPGWFERRLPLGRWTRAVLDEDIPGGASYWYVWGSATTITFLILAATGIWQAFFYVPTTEHAYDSVNFLRFQVPWGWLVHGLHYWAATAMVVLALVHLTQTFVWGAFKKPRELTWLLGALLLIATLAAMFTGTPLPWDKRGFLAAQVGNGIAGSIPLVGGVVKQVLWGGDTVGQLTLSRFFALHVAIVPIVIAAVVLLHIWAFRAPGAAASFSAKRNGSRIGPFWPDQLLKDFVAYSFLFVAMVGLSAFLMTPVTGAADRLDATYIGKPEWPFLFFYEVLKFVPGRLEAMGIVTVMVVGLALLFGVPWLDRSPERDPRRRPVAMLVFAAIVVALVVLSVLGAGGPTEIVTKPSGTASSVETSPTAAAAAVQATAPGIVGNAEHGATLYTAFCETCHGPAGNGNATGPIQGPPLNPIDPSLVSKDPATFARNIDGIIQQGSGVMPPFGANAALTQQQIADIEAYVLRLNGVDRAKVLDPGADPRTFFLVTVVLFGIVDVAAVLGLWRSRRA